MKTAKEIFDKFLKMRRSYDEMQFDMSSSRVYKVDNDTLYQMNLSFYDSDISNYFDINIDICILKENNSDEQTECIKIHILKDGNDKGNIYLYKYSWIRWKFIDVNEIKETIYGMCREYEIDSDFIDFACDLIKIIQNYCLGIPMQ